MTSSLLIALRDLTDTVRIKYANGWVELSMMRTGDLTVNVCNNALVKHRALIQHTLNSDEARDRMDALRIEVRGEHLPCVHGRPHFSVCPHCQGF